MSLHGEHGAWRRRQRRLRSWWRHEQQSVAMALSAAAHGPRAQKTDRAGEAANKALRRQKSKAAGDAVFFELFDEDTAGVRPGVLAEPRPQERVQRHTLEHIVDLVRGAPMVRIIDAPVSQMVEQLPNIVHFFLTRWPVGAEQVFNCEARQVLDVPGSHQDRTRQRLGDSLRQPQTADQLVEVPTIVSYSSSFGNVEQNADIPVLPGRVGVGGQQGLRPGQDSTAFGRTDQVEIPVPRRGFDEGLQGFPPGLGSAASSEQTVHIPVPHGDQCDLHPPSAVDFSNPPDTADQGLFFRTLPRYKKSAKIPRTQQRESAEGVELRASMSLAGVLACFIGNDMGCDYSFWLLLAEWFGLVHCSSWSPLSPSGPEVFAGVD